MWMRFVGFVMRKKGTMITSSLVVFTPEMHGLLEIWHINRRPLLWSIELPRAIHYVLLPKNLSILKA